MEKSQDKGRITTIIACFIMVMSTLGFASGTKTLFPDEVSRALDIERSLFSITETCRYVTTAIINLFFGTLMRKFGAKKLICAGFISIIASMLMYSAANSLLPIYIAGCLLGLGISWTSTTMVGNIVEGWGLKNKGAMMGAILASNGVGGAIAIQIVGGLIDPATVGSYRRAYRAIAIALVIALALVIILMREKYARCEVGKKQPKKNRRRGVLGGTRSQSGTQEVVFLGYTRLHILLGNDNSGDARHSCHAHERRGHRLRRGQGTALLWLNHFGERKVPYRLSL